MITTIQALEPLLVKLAAIGALVALMFKSDGPVEPYVVAALVAVLVGQAAEGIATGRGQAATANNQPGQASSADAPTPPTAV